MKKEEKNQNMLNLERSPATQSTVCLLEIKQLKNKEKRKSVSVLQKLIF